MQNPKGLKQDCFHTHTHVHTNNNRGSLAAADWSFSLQLGWLVAARSQAQPSTSKCPGGCPCLVTMVIRADQCQHEFGICYPVNCLTVFVCVFHLFGLTSARFATSLYTCLLRASLQFFSGDHEGKCFFRFSWCASLTVWMQESSLFSNQGNDRYPSPR